MSCINYYKINNKQKGFAMLEVMLAILIIAIASFGVYKLYTASVTRNNISRTETIIGQVSSAVSRYASAYLSQPTIKDLSDASYISDDITDSSNANFKTPFGPMSYKTNKDNGYDSFDLELDSVPDRAVKDLVIDLLPSANINVDGQDVTEPSSIDSKSMHKVTISYPKQNSSSKS